jgi:hypothetical protein
MSHVTSRLRLPVLTLVVGLLSPVASAAAQERPSSTLVSSLHSLMQERHLEALAAADPTGPDRFVAALLMPDVQLLVVSAQYPVPAELQAQLTQQKYRDIYSALHQPSAQQTRFFLMDVGCDGLRSDADKVDVLYEKGTTQTLFDGRWKQQGLSEAAYAKRMQDAEAHYSHLLSVLISSVQTVPTSVSAPARRGGPGS